MNHKTIIASLCLFYEQLTCKWILSFSDFILEWIWIRGKNEAGWVRDYFQREKQEQFSSSSLPFSFKNDYHIYYTTTFTGCLYARSHLFYPHTLIKKSLLSPAVTPGVSSSFLHFPFLVCMELIREKEQAEKLVDHFRLN